MGSGANNRSGKVLCCDGFTKAVEDGDIIDYNKFQFRFEDTYEALDGWFIADEIGVSCHRKILFCPWCGYKL